MKSLIRRLGQDALFIGEDDGLVVVENFTRPAENQFMIEDHALIIFCTQGSAQFDFDGQTFCVQKNDLFLFIMLHSKVSGFVASPDFNCRQLWFTRSEVWSISMYGKTSITDFVSLRLHPKVTLSAGEASLMESYIQLLCRQLRDREALLYSAIVRSLAGAVLLKVLSLLRKGISSDASRHDSSLHGKLLADRFIQLVELSDGRIRRVEAFASQLNITPKYLSHLLKETINRRPTEIITLFTMKAIQHRLRFTDMTMQEIANDLNFPNPSFFGKYFKDHSGMTPHEYRTKYQE